MIKAGAGRLYVVATPIGNLGDLSARGRETLQACALIAAEDTRHTGTLLQAFGVKTPMVSLHDHNEAQRAPELIERMHAGVSIALVSDAGTPAISDPGYELVRAAAAAGIEVVAVPGACAAIAALSIAALPTDRFCFEGFLPARGSARRARLTALASEPRTLVFYESPHRVIETLEDCAAAFGAARAATVARELTGTTWLEELIGLAEAGGDGHGGELDRVLTVLLAEVPLKQAAGLAARLVSGVRDNEAYKRALQLKDGR